MSIEFENKINLGSIATVVSFISACSLLFANVKQMEATVKELQTSNRQMDKKIELIQKTVDINEYRALDRWSRSDMQRWAAKMSRDNPSVNVPEL